ncbi:MAG: murein biosynthesis integral membrane protein MurJ [Phycisphaeraceae bacterium]|nr:MAG: murein biosynthesis integral membrane protein MurJ [Phycisphaeraceae bacterium]
MPPTRDQPDQPPAAVNPTAGAGVDERTGGAFAAAVRVVSGLTLVSRFAGLARETLVARVLGDSAIGSAFAAAFLIPNLFRRLFGEGALSAAFIPEYVRLLRDDPPQASRLASAVLATLGVVTLGLVALAEIVLGAVLLAGTPSDDARTSIALTMVMLPLMPMVCGTAILGGMLQAHGRYAPPAAAPIILNLFMIAACLVSFLVPDAGRAWTAHAVAWGAVASGVAQLAWSLAALRGRTRWTTRLAGVRPAARTVLTRFMPVVVGMGALQLSTLGDALIAMWPTWIGPTMFGRPVPLDGASNIILSTASRFYQFPLGVFGIAVATAVFPLLARAAHDGPNFASVLHRGLRVAMFIGLPASVGLVLVADDLTNVLLAGGEHAFSREGVARATAVLIGFAPAVWAYSLNNVLTRAFYARGDTATPMRVSIAVVVLNVGLNLALIWPLREAGLAWATTIGACVQFAALAWLCSRHLGIDAVDPGVLRGFLGIAASTAAMAAAVLTAKALLPSPEGWWDHVIGAGVSVAVGGAVFAAAAIALKRPEITWLTQRGPAGGVGAVMAEG